MASPSAPSPRVVAAVLPGRERRASDLLQEARSLERAGCAPEALGMYQRAITTAEHESDLSTLAESLRRLASLRHHRGESAEARRLCAESMVAAERAAKPHLVAEAKHALGCIDLLTGSLAEARQHFLSAIAIGGASQDLEARVEQNLGILANIQGDLDEATRHYTLSLEAYRAGNNEHGCAIAYHNLGLVSAYRELWDDASAFFQRSREIAERAGDVFLRGACHVGDAKVQLARQHFELARQSAECALALFEQLGARAEKSGAYRVIGVVYRETGRSALAESRLRSAIQIAVETGSVLNEAEGSRELALLFQSMGRNQEALTLLNTSHRLFGRLDARRDLINIGAKVLELESTYLAVVREWGQSIESSDSYTFGHCSRVADTAVAVATAFGVDDLEVTAIRLGAYLHDLGKVRVPHEILNKPGPLTRDEFEIIQMHPVWGIEMLAEVEFPWDIKPIIRWHHEKYDGTGYPDRLRGDEIPLSAQIVGIADVYDALTTSRAYRPAMTHAKAMETMSAGRAAWSPAVFEAFERAMTISVAAEAPERLASSHTVS